MPINRRRPGRLPLAGAGALPLLLGGALAGAGPAPATPSPAPSGTVGSGVQLGVSDLYSVGVPTGNWAPVAITVTNTRPSALQGEVVVSVPGAPVSAGQACYPNGPGPVCWAAENLGLPTQYGSTAGPPDVTYDTPIWVAPGTTKHLVVYVLGEVPGGEAQGAVRALGGQVLARSSAPLYVSTAARPPPALVLTAAPAGPGPFAQLVAPGGAHVQAQFLAPSSAPSQAAALGAFGAVLVDSVDTSVLAPAQRQALTGYVLAGGTLIVATGLSWHSSVAGIPSGLLPAQVRGLAPPIKLSGLARLLGAPPPSGPADLAELQVRTGSRVVLRQGIVPIAVRAVEGEGQVIVCALSVSAPPLATWPGTAVLLSRLLWAGHQAEASGRPSSLVEDTVSAGLGGKFAPEAPPGSFPVQGDTTVNGAVIGAESLLGYLEGSLGRAPPSAGLLGFLLVGYVVAVGPLCFFVLARARRRPRAWVVVPCLGVMGALALATAGPGAARGAVADSAVVAELEAGDTTAQLTSVGAVYLPSGGTYRVPLGDASSALPALVADLGAGAGAKLTVGPTSGRPAVVVAGPKGSLGGWAVTGTAQAQGTLEAHVTTTARQDTGEVANELGVRLESTEVVAAAGLAVQPLGALRPGGTARFSIATAPIGEPPVAYMFAMPPETASPAAQQRAAWQALYDLGSAYSAKYGGAPVLVGLAAGPMFSPASGRTGSSASSAASGSSGPLGPPAYPAGGRAPVPAFAGAEPFVALLPVAGAGPA